MEFLLSNERDDTITSYNHHIFVLLADRRIFLASQRLINDNLQNVSFE